MEASTPCVDPEVFVRGGPGPTNKGWKVLSFFLCFFIVWVLVIILFYNLTEGLKLILEGEGVCTTIPKET